MQSRQRALPGCACPRRPSPCWQHCELSPSPSRAPCLRSLLHRLRRGHAPQLARCARGRPLRLRRVDPQQGPARAAAVGPADAAAACTWPLRVAPDLRLRRRARRWTSRRCGRSFAVPEGRLSAEHSPVWRRRDTCCDSHSRRCVPATCCHACQEWMKATPSRRPDIFPEFKPLKPQLPQPMPGDPEVPNDEEEADEKRQKVRQQPGCGARPKAGHDRDPARERAWSQTLSPVRAAPVAPCADGTRPCSLGSRQTRRTQTSRRRTPRKSSLTSPRSRRSRRRSEPPGDGAVGVGVQTRVDAKTAAVGHTIADGLPAAVCGLGWAGAGSDLRASVAAARAPWTAQRGDGECLSGMPCSKAA